MGNKVSSKVDRRDSADDETELAKSRDSPDRGRISPRLPWLQDAGRPTGQQREPAPAEQQSAQLRHTKVRRAWRACDEQVGSRNRRPVPPWRRRAARLRCPQGHAHDIEAHGHRGFLATRMATSSESEIPGSESSKGKPSTQAAGSRPMGTTANDQSDAEGGCPMHRAQVRRQRPCSCAWANKSATSPIRSRAQVAPGTSDGTSHPTGSVNRAATTDRGRANASRGGGSRSSAAHPRQRASPPQV